MTKQEQSKGPRTTYWIFFCIIFALLVIRPALSLHISEAMMMLLMTFIYAFIIAWPVDAIQKAMYRGHVRREQSRAVKSTEPNAAKL